MYSYLEKFIKDYKINIDYNEYTNNELYLMNNIVKTDNIIETDNSNILNFIGLYYKDKIKDNNKAKEYYLKAIELNNNNKNAMNNYGIILEKENKIEEAKKYYLKALEIDNMNISALNNYAYILYKQNKIEEAKQYYLKGIELNNSYAMNGYGYILENENKIEEAKIYYLKAIELNNKPALHNYLTCNINKIQKYIDLSSIKSNITKDKLIKLEKDRDVLIYKNKLKHFSEIKECELCFNTNLNIYLNCFNHMICTDCYPKIYNDKCPFCRL